MGDIAIYPPGGALASTLGYMEVIANQTGISTSSVDLTGLLVTVTVPAGRRIRLTGYVTFDNQNAGQNAVALELKEGATRINFAQSVMDPSGGTTGDLQTLVADAIITPSAGAHTYKLTAVCSLATVDLVASATAPAFILVEDITGTVWPTGSAVTAGMIASEAWIPWTPALTNLTLGNGVVTAKYQRIGRTIIYRFKFKLGSTSAVGTDPKFSLPVAPHAEYVSQEDNAIGSGMMLDTGTQLYPAILRYEGGSNVTLFVFSVGGTYANLGQVTATIPFTWTTNDAISISGIYEAAA
jgi:hypothetical protein